MQIKTNPKQIYMLFTYTYVRMKLRREDDTRKGETAISVIF